MEGGYQRWRHTLSRSHTDNKTGINRGAKYADAPFLIGGWVSHIWISVGVTVVLETVSLRVFIRQPAATVHLGLTVLEPQCQQVQNRTSGPYQATLPNWGDISDVQLHDRAVVPGELVPLTVSLSINRVKSHQRWLWLDAETPGLCLKSHLTSSKHRSFPSCCRAETRDV